MKLSPESPELTAFVLNELSEEQRRQVQDAIAASAELRDEIAQLDATAARLAVHFASEPAVGLVPAQRQEVLLRGARPQLGNRFETARSGSSSAEAPWWQLLRERWIWMTTAIAALAFTAFIWLRPPVLQHTVARANSELAAREARTLPTSATQLPSVSAPPIAEQQRSSVKLALMEAERAVELEALSRVSRGASLLPRLKATAGDAGRQSVEFEVGSTIPSSQIDDDMYSAPTALSLADSLASSDPRVAAADRPYSLEAAESLGQSTQGNALRLRRETFEYRLTLALDVESYATIPDSQFKSTTSAPLSSFGLDVDTASYSNLRRFLREGSLPPADAVRLEELINYFHYDYPAPRGNEPFASTVEITDCPWNEGHRLVRIGVQAKSIARGERPRANLVFLLDVSGSMEPENKLPLVKRSLRLLLDRLSERDAVSIVTYAGESRVALEPTAVTEPGRQRITAVLEGLRSGSGTAGSVGIQNAYALATNRFIAGGVNRVLLCTDGDFNLGITDPGDLQRLIEEQAKSGVFLSVLGFGMGNIKDSTLELLADKGNGTYAYLDSFAEARKVLVEQLEGTLVTVAKDVKVQVEFNPSRVRAYRLLGYENRQLRDRDFNDDTKDGGEIGAGHQVTMLYEIEPAGPSLTGTDPLRYQPKPDAALPVAAASLHAGELLNLKIRYKAPDGDQSSLIESPVKDSIVELSRSSADLKFAIAVAGYGMLLRSSADRGTLTWDSVLRLAEQGLGSDKEGYRAEFVDLARKAQQLSGGK